MDLRICLKRNHVQSVVKDLTSNKPSKQGISDTSLGLLLCQNLENVDDFIGVILARLFSYRSTAITIISALRLMTQMLKLNVPGVIERCKQALPFLHEIFNNKTLQNKANFEIFATFDELFDLIKNSNLTQGLNDKSVAERRTLRSLVYDSIRLGKSFNRVGDTTKILTSEINQPTKLPLLIYLLEEGDNKDKKHFLDVLKVRLVSRDYNSRHKSRALGVLKGVLSSNIRNLLEMTSHQDEIIEKFLHYTGPRQKKIRRRAAFICKWIKIFKESKKEKMAQQTEAAEPKEKDAVCTEGASVDEMLEILYRKHAHYLSLGAKHQETIDAEVSGVEENFVSSPLLDENESDMDDSDSESDDSFETCLDEMNFELENLEIENLRDNQTEKSEDESISIDAFNFPDVPNDEIIVELKCKKSKKTHVAEAF